jgi:hypothetical protein
VDNNLARDEVESESEHSSPSSANSRNVWGCTSFLQIFSCRGTQSLAEKTTLSSIQFPIFIVLGNFSQFVPEYSVVVLLNRLYATR